MSIYDTYKAVIGLECHIQLSTKTKMYSNDIAEYGALPNSNISAITLGHPGTLPKVNKKAIEYAVKLGLAMNCTIREENQFARKNYFYADLPKGYQITQDKTPICNGGWVDITLKDGSTKKINLTRIHMEEDAGKSLHDADPFETLIDLNRAGTPLLEIVTEPVMRSAAEAVAYAKALHTLVVWLGVCDGNMQEGSFRCDANVSVRPVGQKEFGTRCEIKNLNSFRFLEEAIQYEVRRQIELIEDGGVVVQETRLYDPDRQETRSMRSKEDANDYRYFPDPDLLPVVIDDGWIADVRSKMPALPAQLREQWQNEFGLSAYDTQLLTQDRDTAKVFEELLAIVGKSLAKAAANLIAGEFASSLNRAGIATADAPLKAEHLAPLLTRVADGTISNKIAKDIFAILWEEAVAGKAISTVDQVIDAKGLKQISDSGELEAMIDKVLAANEKSVEEFRSGKEKAFNALVGQIMKASQGKANPGQVNELLRKKLG